MQAFTIMGATQARARAAHVNRSALGVKTSQLYLKHVSIFYNMVLTTEYYI